MLTRNLNAVRMASHMLAGLLLKVAKKTPPVSVLNILATIKVNQANPIHLSFIFQCFLLFLINKDVCILPEPPKTCFNYSLKWRFEVNEGRCVQFWFGGCDENANLFETSEECEGKCVNPNGTEICRLPLVNPAKQCLNNVTRYYYDLKASTCKMFTYSGCFGNANNFETIEECERRCQVPLLFGKFILMKN